LKGTESRQSGIDIMLSGIRNAKRSEMDLFMNAAQAEGWNPGLHDAESFYACDEKGFWLGTDEEGSTVSILSFVNYPRSDFSFVGFYVVSPGHRHQGNGFALWAEIFRRNLGRNVGLDGVQSQIGDYTKSGFVFCNNNIRYCGHDLRPSGCTDFLLETGSVPFSDICAYDRLHFPAPRERFLRSWIRDSHRSMISIEGKTIRGFGVVRRCLEGYKVGPLFCDSSEIARDMLTGLIGDIEGENVYLDVMDDNPEAKALVEDLGMAPTFSTARMYLGERPDVRWNGVFGITSFELG
jgi:hypothetical protein